MLGGNLQRTYANPNQLESLGPLIRGSWAVPAKSLPLNPYLRARFPGPVHGYLAIDTGSNRTWMGQAVVEALDLSACSEETAHGSAGVHRTPIYLAELVVPFAGDETRDASLTAVLPVAAVPRLDEMMPLQTDDPNGQLIGLLGRDFLRHVRFTYDGPGGSFSLKLGGRDVQVVDADALAARRLRQDEAHA